MRTVRYHRQVTVRVKAHHRQVTVRVKIKVMRLRVQEVESSMRTVQCLGRRRTTGEQRYR